MPGIIRKDVFWFAIASLVILPLTLTAERLISIQTPPLVIGANSLLLAVLIIGPVLITEQDEEKSSGYLFLGSLPLTRREVTAAKFTLPLIPLVAGIMGCAALNRTWSLPVELVTISESVMILTGMVCLAICGLAYVAIMGFGYTRFFLGAMVAVLALSVLAPFVLHSGIIQPRVMINWLADTLLHLNRPLLVAVGLGIYLALMFLASVAIRFEPRRRTPS